MPFFEWCESLAISQVYRESLWLFTVTQCLHLVAITTFIGAILIVDLQLLGWGPVRQPRAELARSAHRILLWAGVAVLGTGIPQFMTNAVTYARSPIFAFKMSLLAAALIFTVTVRRRVAVADEEQLPAWVSPIVGAASIVLWMGVPVSGRMIAYY